MQRKTCLAFVFLSMRVVRLFITFTFCLLCLAWIGINSFDVLQRGQSISPQNIFSAEDQEIWILNRFDRPSSDLPFKLGSFHQKVLQAAKNLYTFQIDRIYFSKGKTHFLLEGNQMWTNENIESWCSSVDEKVRLEENWLGHKEWGPYRISQDQNFLYFESTENTRRKIESDFTFDKLADFSVIDLATKTQSDYYLREDVNVLYSKKPSSKKTISTINDRENFAAYLPESIDKLVLYAKDYFSAVDPDFKAGWMKSWTNTGVAFVEFQGEQFILTDFLSSNGPERILTKNFEQSALDRANKSFMSSKQLCGAWSRETEKKYHYQIIDNHIIICKNPVSLEQYAAAIIQGATVANNSQKSKRLYASLPTEIHQRIWTEDKGKTIALFEGKEIISEKFERYQSNENKGSQQVYRLALDGILKGHVAWDNSNKHWLYSDKLSSRFYATDTILSTKSHQRILGQPQAVTWEEDAGLLISDGEKIDLARPDGSSWEGFPRKPPSDIYTAPIAFANSGELDLVFGNKEGELWFLHQRKWIRLRTDLRSPKQELIRWTSAGKTFIGWADERTWVMVDADARKVYRSYEVPSNAVIARGPNEISHFSLTNKKIKRISQKGEAESLNIQRDILRLISTEHGVIALHESGALLLDETGFMIGEWSMENTNEIDFAATKIHQGELFACFLNTVSNRVLLFRYIERIEVSQACDKQPSFYINEDKELKLVLPYQQYLTIVPVLN